MSRKSRRSALLPSAGDDIKFRENLAKTAQTQSSSYKLAFADQEFLVSDVMRPIRLQLELQKPELALQDNNIERTIVVFGSARNKSRDEAQKTLSAAEQAHKKYPDDSDIRFELEKARAGLRHAVYYEHAHRFGQLVATDEANQGPGKATIVTGGGPGIMEGANKGAFEAGALSIGHNITLAHEQTPNSYITPELCFQFHYFAIRKMHLMMRAIALVVFPGGYGTLDELFEGLCLIQTGKVKRMPVLLFDETYWRRIVNFEVLVEEGVISAKDLDLFRYVSNAEEAWDIIKQEALPLAQE